MNAYTIQVDSDTPEEVSLSLHTNGHKGGDSGHGGFTRFRIQLDSEGLIVEDSRGYRTADAEWVTITTKGDWETTGFFKALTSLGQRLGNCFYVTTDLHESR